MFVPNEWGIKRINDGDILFIQSYAHKAIITTKSGEYYISASLKDLENKLSGDKFYRINKSYIVNLDHVTAVAGNQVFINDHIINLRRGGKKIFIEALEQTDCICC